MSQNFNQNNKVFTILSIVLIGVFVIAFAFTMLSLLCVGVAR